MDCIVCSSPVPEGTFECPGCGDHLGQWMTMNQLAGQLAEQGVKAAEQGRPTAAILSLKEACVLKPDEPAPYLHLGQVLLQCGDRENAEYYLNLCLSHSVKGEIHQAAQDLLSQMNEPDGAIQVAELLHLADTPRIPRDTSEADAPKSTDPLDEAWAAVTQLDCQWTDDMLEFAPVLSWTIPKDENLQSPYAYLRAVFALARGDQDGARELLRQAVKADASRHNADVYLLYLSTAEQDAAAAVEFLLSQQRSADDVSHSLMMTVQLLQDRERTVDCVALLGQVLKLEPENQVAQKLLKEAQDSQQSESAEKPPSQNA